jgi:predicted NBD/HSP70 family sugar kinase
MGAMSTKGLSSLEVRQGNIQHIFNLLYQRKAMTKQDIVTTLGLSLPTVSLILKELTDRGFVGKSGTLDSSGGRKPELNALIYDARITLGMELAQGYLRIVASDLAGEVLHCDLVPVKFTNTEAYYRELGELATELMTRWKIDRERTLGVGIAIPGIVDRNVKMVEFAPTLGVRNLPFETITRFILYPTELENEANLAGLAELWGREQLNNAVYVSLNKGIGGAIIIDSKIFTGLGFRAGEFGHMTIQKDGKKCSCGKRGCLEAYCSTTELFGKGKDLDAFTKGLQNGKADCRKRLETYLDYLAIGINNLHMAFDSDIIVGGAVNGLLQEYAGDLHRRVAEHDLFDNNASYLHIGKFDGTASAVGAALLLVSEFMKAI